MFALHSRAKGDIAENLASEFLKALNFKIVERNFYTKFGEIDIIALKDGVYHFVEVKSGKKFEPLHNITPKKIERIYKSALIYMKRKNLDSAYSLDAIIVRDSEVEMVENITL